MICFSKTKISYIHFCCGFVYLSIFIPIFNRELFFWFWVTYKRPVGEKNIWNFDIFTLFGSLKLITDYEQGTFFGSEKPLRDLWSTKIFQISIFSIFLRPSKIYYQLWTWNIFWLWETFKRAVVDKNIFNLNIFNLFAHLKSITNCEPETFFCLQKALNRQVITTIWIMSVKLAH